MAIMQAETLLGISKLEQLLLDTLRQYFNGEKGRAKVDKHNEMDFLGVVRGIRAQLLKLEQDSLVDQWMDTFLSRVLMAYGYVDLNDFRTGELVKTDSSNGFPYDYRSSAAMIQTKSWES